MTRAPDAHVLYEDRFEVNDDDSDKGFEDPARTIAQAVLLHTNASERQRMLRSGTARADAYAAYREAEHLHQLANYDALRQAAERLRTAIALQEAQLFELLNAGSGTAESFRIYGRLLAGAGELTLGSEAIARFLEDPRSSNLAIGVVLFALGDFEGARFHWRRMDGNQLNVLSINRPSLERLLPEHVLSDQRYGELLDEIGLGSEWSNFLSRRAAGLMARLGLDVSETPRATVPLTGVASSLGRTTTRSAHGRG